MILDGLFIGLEKEPIVREFRIDDYNPLSRQRKIRKITAAGNDEMKILQRRLVTRLRTMGIMMPNATGGVVGSNPMRNIRRHIRWSRCRRSYFPSTIFLTDIQSAYQNTPIESLAKILAKIDGSGEVDAILVFLRKYCSAGEGLAVGLASSPDLFNIYCEYSIDLILRQWCYERDITYTRYLDDLTFSTNGDIGQKRRRFIRRVVGEAGFELCDHKTKLLHPQKQAVIINGIGVNVRGQCFMTGDTITEIEGLIENVLKVGMDSLFGNRLKGLGGLFRYVTRARVLTGRERLIMQNLDNLVPSRKSRGRKK